VTDNQGASGTATATVTVSNAPFVVNITAPTAPAPVNTVVAASATIADPGTIDTHTASWDWGDGTKTSGTVTESGGSGIVAGSHAFASAGSYPVTLCVADDDGTTATAHVVVAISPTGGFTGANLPGANYSGANLTGQNLSGSNAKSTTLTGTTLTNANLSGANLQGANLQGANLKGANLTNANLQYANLAGANLSNANLTKANLHNATLSGVIWSNTTCPDKTNSTSDGGTCVGHL
jgi:hypothetical protein